MTVDDKTATNDVVEQMTQLSIQTSPAIGETLSSLPTETTVPGASAACVGSPPPPHMLSFDDTWKVVEKFWSDVAFVNDSLRSYERFVSNLNKIPVPPIDVKCDVNNSHRNTRHLIKFERCYVGKPLYNEDDPNRKAGYSSHPKSKSKMENVSFVTPHEAMERSLTFSVPVCYDVVHEIWKKNSPEDTEYKLIEKRLCDKLPVGDIPVAVGSSCDGVDRNTPPEHRHECPYEPKGAFIVNGTKRIIVPQSRMAWNKVLVFLKVTNKPMLVAEIRSLAERDFSDPAPIYVKFRAFKGRGEETFRLKFPYVKYDIHLSTVFRALGVCSDREICMMMTQGSRDEQMTLAVQPTLEAGIGIRDQSDALVHIARKAQQFPKDEPLQNLHNYAYNIINRDLFPHMGKKKTDFRQKALYLGYVAWKILRVHLKEAEVDDRDHCGNKRYDYAGPLLESMYFDMMEALSREVGQMMSKWLAEGKPLNDVAPFIKKKPITQRFGYVMSTGNWTCNTNKRTNKTGVTAVIQGLSHIAAMSHARRGNTRIGREGKLTKPRQLGNNQWGMIDPSQTPEGTNIGLVFNSALISHISNGDTSGHFSDILAKSKMIPLDRLFQQQESLSQETVPSAAPRVASSSSRFVGGPNSLSEEGERTVDRWYRVFVNGKWIGMIESPLPLMQKLQRMKRSMDINYETGISIKRSEKSLFINTDSGRTLRPYLVVDPKTGFPVLTKERIESLAGTRNPRYKDSFSALVAEGCVEMLDVDEEDNAMIAMFVKDLYAPDASLMKYTHCEIHPATLYGEITGATIPFLNHNPPPRITFQGAMGQHAIGMPMLNYHERMDTPLHVLYYPSKPLTSTKTWKLLKMDEMPSGQESMVLVLSFDGYDMEDSIDMNGRSIDLGYMRSTTYRVMRDTEANFGNHYSEEFKRPDRERCLNMRRGCYDKLEDDGTLSPGVTVLEDDVVTGKTSANTTSDDPKFVESDHSCFNRSFKHGIVDSVLITSNEQGFRTVKTKIRTTRIPQVGDKYCLAEGTEVLTLREGWKLLEHAKVGELVATLQPDTGRLEYAPVSALFEYHHDGPMYKIQTQQVDLLTTLNHKMWVKQRNANSFGLVEARELVGKRVSYQKNARWTSPEDYLFVLPELAKQKVDSKVTTTTERLYPAKTMSRGRQMDAWLWFFGMWMTEGYVSWHDKNKRIVVCTHKQRVKDKLEWVCQELGWHLIYARDKTLGIVYDIQTCSYMRQFSGGATSKKKKLPDWVWSLNEDQCQTLLRGMLLGDGHITNTRTQIYSTSSSDLADDFQRLCLHSGWSATKTRASVPVGTVYNIENRTGVEAMSQRLQVTTADWWRLGVNVSKNTPTVNHGHVHRQHGQVEGIVQYSGKVRCIEVPSHVFLVRRNGKVVWTGNSACHGQKGVIGRVVPPELLPFSLKDGSVPDIIINPHAFPGRMTIGMLLEMLAGKAATATGKSFDATPFERCNREEDELTTQEELESLLLEAGLQPKGNEVFYNAITGKQFEAKMFFGSCYYQRLKHMVDDKLHARSTGPKHIVTRQPVDGRARDGGLRFGEMERDCLIAYGAAWPLHNRTCRLSDMHPVLWCSKCGSFGYKNTINKMAPPTFRCERNSCDSSDIRTIYMPYAFKLLNQELKAMGVDTVLEVCDTKEQARGIVVTPAPSATTTTKHLRGKLNLILAP